MISDTEYAQAVAEFLSNKGVTRCPTVCVVPTSASISDADCIALRSYGATREATWQARRQKFQQIISYRGVSQDSSGRGAATGQLVSGPHTEAEASP